MSATVNGTQVTADSAQYGAMIRLFQVNQDGGYINTTTPQTNDLSLSIPWSRASPANVGDMSAMCYYLAIEMLASVGRLRGKGNAGAGRKCAQWVCHQTSHAPHTTSRT